jgi:hypothetical protein
LRELSDVAVARGLITFLNAVSTVCIALVLTIYAVVPHPANGADNFDKAKQVLSVLMGVLGTIVGFYFGQATSPPPKAQQVSEMKILSVKVEPATVKPGDKFKITAEIFGGEPPYDYAISFTPGKISTLNKQGSDGKIAEEFTVPQNISPGTTLQLAINAKDKTGKSVESEKPVMLSIGQ